MRDESGRYFAICVGWRRDPADAHAALDAAVAAAYGWSAEISDDEGLCELPALKGGGQ